MPWPWTWGELTGNQRLAAAVFLRTIAAPDRARVVCRWTRAGRLAKHRALRWVHDAGELFKFWCAVAGRDWRTVRRSLLRRVSVAERELPLAMPEAAIAARPRWSSSAAKDCRGSRYARHATGPRLFSPAWSRFQVSTGGYSRRFPSDHTRRETKHRRRHCDSHLLSAESAPAPEYEPAFDGGGNGWRTCASELTRIRKFANPPPSRKPPRS